MHMLDGLDAHLDPMGLIRHEEFVCGDCKHSMMPIGHHRYQCPHCGIVFDDSANEEPEVFNA